MLTIKMKQIHQPGNLSNRTQLDGLYARINANVTWRDVEDKYWVTVYGKNLRR